MEIFKPNSSFDFAKITLANPQPLQGSSYFTKINYGNDENTPSSLYIQLPKCLTKQAFIATKRGKYGDLMYEHGVHDEFIEWIEHLELMCKNKIDEKKELWFQNEFTRDDIDTMMTPIARMYKLGKYVLVRSYINENKHTGKDKCIVYNENEVSVELDSINAETFIIPLILIDGIKFTSRSFEIDLKIVQIMVLDKTVPAMTTPLIKKSIGALTLNTSLATRAEELPPLAPSQVVIVTEQNNPSSIIMKNEEIPDQSYLEITTKENTNSFPLDKSIIEEVNINYETIHEQMSDLMYLKKSNEIYYEQFQTAKHLALQLRELAINAILKAKTIKEQYNLKVSMDGLDEYL
jgi:hypothetical protein